MGDVVSQVSVRGNHYGFVGEPEWDDHYQSLLDAPPGSITALHHAAPFQIEIEITEPNSIRLIFKNEAGEICARTISDPLFYERAYEYRQMIEGGQALKRAWNEGTEGASDDDIDAYARMLRAIQASGTQLLRRALQPEIKFEAVDEIVDQHDPARDLFFLCAYAVRPRAKRASQPEPVAA